MTTPFHSLAERLENKARRSEKSARAATKVKDTMTAKVEMARCLTYEEAAREIRALLGIESNGEKVAGHHSEGSGV